MAQMFYQPAPIDGGANMRNAASMFAQSALQLQQNMQLAKQSALLDAEQRRVAFFQNAEKFGFGGNIPGYINTPMGAAEYSAYMEASQKAINADKLLGDLTQRVTHNNVGAQAVADATDIANQSYGSLSAGAQLDAYRRSFTEESEAEKKKRLAWENSQSNPNLYNPSYELSPAQLSTQGVSSEETPVLQAKPAFNSPAAFPDKTGNAQAFTQNPPNFSSTPATGTQTASTDPNQAKLDAAKIRLATLEAEKDPLEQKKLYRAYEYADMVTAKPGDTHLTQNTDGTWKVKNINNRTFPTREDALQALVINRDVTFAPGERAQMAGIKTPNDMTTITQKLRSIIETASSTKATPTGQPIQTTAPIAQTKTTTPVASAVAPQKPATPTASPATSELRQQLSAVEPTAAQSSKSETELWLNAPQSFQDQWRATHGGSAPPGVKLTKTPYAQKALDAAMVKTADSATIVSQKGADILANVEQEKPITSQQAASMQQALIQTGGNYQRALEKLTPEAAKAIEDAAVNKVLTMNSTELELAGMSKVADRQAALEALITQLAIQQMLVLAQNTGEEGLRLKDALEAFNKTLEVHYDHGVELVKNKSYKNEHDLMENNAAYKTEDEQLRKLMDSFYSATGTKISTGAIEAVSKQFGLGPFKITYGKEITVTDPAQAALNDARSSAARATSRADRVANTYIGQ